MKYKKIFLKEIKSLVPYFIKFNKILSEEYLSNCAVRDLNQWLIIIITYDENIFSANNNCQKI